MITTHIRPIPKTFVAGTPDWDTPMPSGSGMREWTFLPPIIAMWCRADDFGAFQVHDYSQIIAKKISVCSFCESYCTGLPLVTLQAATIIEADPCEYKIIEPTESLYTHVTQVPGCPTTASLALSQTGWGTAVTIWAYGGNNDGAPCGTVKLKRVGGPEADVYALTSPGVLRIDRFFSQFWYTRMDWTGGANWATVDAYIAERQHNVEMH